MGHPGAVRERMTLEEACELMAGVIKQELGTEVTAKQVEEVFERRWDRLSTLAHAIHRNIVALRPPT